MNLRQVYFGLIAIAGVALTDLSFAQQQVEIRGPKDATEQYSGATYGPIQSSDTLWRIANRYRQNKNLTIYQVMQAIYDLNPDAFENNNFNQLKNGAILRLPSERYVARIDAEEAKNRAELDDLNWQPRAGADPSVQATPRSPAETLASKDDLSQTKEDLEKKLVAIDEEQNRQFMAIRQQFAESINSVQTLLDENQKLYDRLDVVNQDIEGLRTRVDEELKIQIDQVLDIQNELLAISREAEAQRQAEMQKSGFDFLNDPLTLIIGSVVITLSFLVGLALWLLKRRKTEPAVEQPVMQAPVEAPLTEQASEMDDLTDALSDELSDELDEDLGSDDLFGEDDLLDDVLSDELQESLDEALDEELESFDDLGDEMLVPESDKSAADEEEGEAVLEQGDLDSLFDEDADLSELDGEMDAIDLSDTDELTDDIADDVGDELDQVLDDTDIDDLLDESIAEASEFDDALEQAEEAATPEAAVDDDVVEPEVEEVDTEAESLGSVEDDQEKPEISIDELLEEPEPAIPETIDVDDSEAISEEMLQQLDKEIANQNQELDSITDELINEIEQLEQMEGMLPPDEDEEDSASEPQHGIQQLDELSEDIETELSADSGDEQDSLADELLAEMGVDIEDDAATETSESLVDESQTVQADEQEDLADELLAELGVDEGDGEPELEANQGPEADQQDDLADELLAELGVEPDAEPTETDEVAESAVESVADAQDDLADELLAEMGVDDESDIADAQSEPDVQDDLADELLNELGVDEADDEPVDADFDSEEQGADVAVEPENNEQTDAEFEQDELDTEPLAEDDLSSEPTFEAEQEETQADQDPSEEVQGEEIVNVAEETSDAVDDEVVEQSVDEISDDLLEEELGADPEAENVQQDVPEIENATDGDVETGEDATLESMSDGESHEPLLTDSDVEDASVDELLQELDDAAPDNLPDEVSDEVSEEIGEDVTDDSAEESVDEDSISEAELTEDELDIPSFTESEAQDPIDAEKGQEDEFDKALDDFDQELEGSLDMEPEPAGEGDDFPETAEEIDFDVLDEGGDADVAEKLVEDLPGLEDIDSLTGFDDSELEKALDSYAEDHQELALDEEEPEKPKSASKPEDLDDVPGLDDWLGNDSDEDALDDSLLEELENTSFDELLDNIEDNAEEQTAEQDALLDNPDLDLEALLTEDDTLDELDVELVENEVEEPEEDFLDVDSLLNESIEAESEPMVEKELDLDVSLEEFTGVTGDADSIDVDSDQGLGAKMDLARAYLEIEDNDSARELLKEIAEKGDDEQKAEAQELLNSL